MTTQNQTGPRKETIMQTSPIKLTDVIYNAANQSFEACVTVYGETGARKYACAIEAPITMSFEDAAKGLRTQALRRHAKRGGLHSQMRRFAPQQRAPRSRFDPVRWLETLISGEQRNAA
jgi:hypothetical protein